MKLSIVYTFVAVVRIKLEPNMHVEVEHLI